MSADAHVTTADGNASTCRWGLYGALSAIAGIVLSGPLAVGVVRVVHAQPAWRSPRVFAENYHPVQTLPYFFGLLFVGGCVAMVAAMRDLADATRRTRCRLGLLASGLGATFVFLNYVIQTTFVPAVIRGGRPEWDVVLASLTMVNPGSLAWALEMWGYAFLGLGSWLAAPVFDRGGLERAARLALAGNGLIGLAGAAVTVVRLEWVLGAAGLASYAAWNAYFLVTLVLVAIAFRRRGHRG